MVAEQVGDDAAGNMIYHVLFDGSVNDEHGFVAIGGHAERLTETLRSDYEDGWDLPTAVGKAVAALSGAEERSIAADDVEAGVLDRTRSQRRKFRRLSDSEVGEIVGAS